MTVCEVVTVCVCMYTMYMYVCMYVCMYVRMYVHVCVALLSRCVQQLKPKPLQVYQTRWSKSYTRAI